MALTKRATGADPGPLAFDELECRRALAALADPAHACQLFAMPSFQHRNDSGGNPVALVSFAHRHAQAGDQIYVVLNPVPKAWDRRANAGCVVSRRWLFVDVDPAKPEAFKDASATDGEKFNAGLLGDRIRDDLYGYGWGLPLRIDSGNGNYLLYRIDLPNDKLSRVLVREFLHALAAKYDGADGHVGKECSNADRLAKLPGTTAAKGAPTAERPHRPCKILQLPGALPTVTAEQIAEATRRLRPVPPAPATPAPARLKAKVPAANGAGPAYGQKALHDEAAKVAQALAGWRNDQLNTSAFRLGQLVGAGLLTRAEAERELSWAAKECGLCDDPGCGERGVNATIASGLDAGTLEPRAVPELNGVHTPAYAAVPPGDSIIVRASTVVPRKVEWLWPGRIPLGKLTTFAGVGGLGKTFVLCDVAARVSRGLDWPDSAGECQPVGQVLFMSGEDDPDDTLVPRLMECDADLTRICFLKMEVLNRFSLADLETLDRAVAEVGDGVRLVVVDPPTSFLLKVDDHKNAELRSVLSPLGAWSSKNRVATVFNTHFNKAQGKVPAMMRVMASVAWVNAVRAAHMFARDPDDEERRLFIPMKMNLAKERKGLAYRITPAADDQAKVDWLGEVDLSADEAANATSATKRRSVVATEWLVERFREKLAWPSDELFARAREDNVSRNAIFEAKATLQLPKARQVITEDGGKVFTWWVPADWPNLTVPEETETPGQWDNAHVTPFD